MERTNVEFRDNGHLMQIIDRIVSKVGRRVDETCPMVDARLQDGSRVKRHHSAARIGRSRGLDSSFWFQSLKARRPVELPRLHAGNGDVARGLD